ncbi:unnamed protein product [Soboliphyme baturini]|uniref:ANK_REP_REGION domain-containing protein n=1 Tax=Soboliphyme baturini TaxID=241478 RepID=A0A183IL95_9BILA|nr:unnamed protein product [Soboliphyme baturini]
MTERHIADSSSRRLYSKPGLRITAQPFAFCPFVVENSLIEESSLDRHLLTTCVKVDGSNGERGHVRCVLYTNEHIPRRHVNKIFFQSEVCDEIEVALDENLEARIVIAIVITRSLQEITFKSDATSRAQSHIPSDVLMSDGSGGSVPKQPPSVDSQHNQIENCLHSVRLGMQAFFSGNDVVSTPIMLSQPVCDTDQVELVFFEPLTGWQSIVEIAEKNILSKRFSGAVSWQRKLNCKAKRLNVMTVLHIAVRNKQSFALMTLLKALEKHPDQRAIINHENFRKQTALHLAVRFDDPDSVHYLLTAGADRSVQDINGCNVAHHLCDSFNEDIYRDILFPPEGSPASATSLDLSTKNILGYHPLALAVKRKKLALVENFIEAKADINQLVEVNGMHALHLVVEAGDMDILDLLLKVGRNYVIYSFFNTNFQLVYFILKSRILVTLMRNHLSS